MATFAWNADGSAGTADSSPTSGHPIGYQSLNLSETQLSAMLTFAGDFITFMSGGSLTSTTSRNTTIDGILG